MIQLDTRRRAHVLARLRAEAAPIAARWAAQGLVPDAAREVEALAARVERASSLWALARSISPALLGCLLGVIMEARQAELLEGRSRRGIRSIWRVDPADVEAAAATMARLALAPGTVEVRAEFRLDAQRYAHLARTMRARDDLPHRPGRRREAASEIEDACDMLLVDRPQAERRAWAARLIADLTGGDVSTRRVGSRQRARASRARARNI